MRINQIQYNKMRSNEIQSNKMRTNQIQSNKMRTNQMICNQIQIESDHKEGDGPQTQHHSASDSLSHRSGDSVAAELALGPHVIAFTQTGLPLLIPRTMRAARRLPTLGLRELDQLIEANEVDVGHA